MFSSLLKLLLPGKAASSWSFTGIILIAFGVSVGTLYVMWSLAKGKNLVLEAQITSLQGALKQVSAIGQAQQKTSKATLAAANRAILDQKDEYQEGLSSIKEYYEKKLANKSAAINRLQRLETDRPDSSGSCGVSSEDASTTALDGGTSDEVLSRRSLEEQCTVTTWMLLKLQEHEKIQQQIYGGLPDYAPTEHETLSDTSTNETQESEKDNGVNYPFP